MAIKQESETKHELVDSIIKGYLDCVSYAGLILKRFFDAHEINKPIVYSQFSENDKSLAREVKFKMIKMGLIFTLDIILRVRSVKPDDTIDGK